MINTRFYFKLFRVCQSVLIINRSVNMSQKTLLSFFKPPKVSNNVSTAKGTKESCCSNSVSDSPKKVSDSKPNGRVPQTMENEAEEESVGKRKDVSETSSSPAKSPKPNSVNSHTPEKVNILGASSNGKSETEITPKRITAQKKLPGPHMEKLLAGKSLTDNSSIKKPTGEPAFGSHSSPCKSSDIEMETEDDPPHKEEKVSENGDLNSHKKEHGVLNPHKEEKMDENVDLDSHGQQKMAENGELDSHREEKMAENGDLDSHRAEKMVENGDLDSPRAEKVSENGYLETKSEKIVSPQKKDSSEKDKEECIPAPQSSKTDVKPSKKRKKNNEKSPKTESVKRAKKADSKNITIESNEKKPKKVKKEINAEIKDDTAKLKSPKKENALIHSFFARTTVPKTSSSTSHTTEEESKLSTLKVDEKLSIKTEKAEDVGSDVEMKEPENEMLQTIPEVQKGKNKSKRNSPKQNKTEANTESTTNDELVDADDSDQGQTPKKVIKKSRNANRIIDSDEEEECNVKKEECNVKKEECDVKKEECNVRKEEGISEKMDDVADTISEQESEEKSTENKKAKTQIHSFFVPKVKEEKGKKGSSSKESKVPSSSEKLAVYDPAKAHYHPIDDACWKKGESVPYLALARTMEEIENISKRLKIIEMLANYFRSVIVLSPDDLLHSVYLCVNRIAPEYEGIEMGVGETLLMKAVAQATGRTLEKVKAEAAVMGDLGLVAESSRGNQRYMFAPPKLTVAFVFAKFKEIAMMSGNASMSKKVDKIQALFVACRQCEARYIIRSLSGKLRIGLAEQSVLTALAQAAVLTPPNQVYPPEILNSSSKPSSGSFRKKLDAQVLILKTTYCECPNYDKIIPILLREGMDGLPKHCYLSPGIPLKPMLAHPTKGIEEVLRRFDGGNFTCEFKYDGERAQIHVLENGEVKIYSRNQEDNTTKFPDIISRISKALNVDTKSCILDTEAVAWDRDTKQILPFQKLSTRKRKDVVESEIKVQVCVVAFDLIYLNGESLVKMPLKERRRLLHESFVEVKNEFMFVNSTDGNTAEVMQEFLEESIKGNCEGLMVKSLEVDASYEIAKRSHNWLKLKKDYLDGVGDTLDLVVIGGYHGKGKRTGAYGGFLLACYDDDNEEFQTICKIGTGFKEEEFESLSAFLKEHVISEPKSYFRFESSAMTPDVWFEPVQVWEVKCADLSKSPVHKAAIGIVDPEKGISLRFPRFLRIRDDKKTEDATTSSQVAHMYNSQEQIQNQKTRDSNIDEEDFY